MVESFGEVLDEVRKIKIDSDDIRITPETYGGYFMALTELAEYRGQVKLEAMKKYASDKHFRQFLGMLVGPIGVNLYVIEEFQDVLRLSEKQKRKMQSVYDEGANVLRN
jgi:hypothetical protein